MHQMFSKGNKVLLHIKLYNKITIKQNYNWIVYYNSYVILNKNNKQLN